MFVASGKAVSDPDVLFTPLHNGEGVLLHLGTKKYYSLNVTGSRIWQLITKGLSLAEIGSELEAGFEVSLEQAQQSVAELANQLASETLIRFADG